MTEKDPKGSKKQKQTVLTEGIIKNTLSDIKVL